MLLLLLSLAAYLSNGRVLGAGDTLPARYLPWTILRQHTLALDPFPSLYGEAARRSFPLLDGIPYYLRFRDGHYRSAYTPAPAVLALPVYVVPVLLGANPESWAAALEKLSASLITAVSVVVLWSALRELVTAGWALAIAVVYALGTSSLSVSAQALWQHGPSQLCLCAVIYCLVRGLRDERYLAYSGFAMSAAAVMRSTDALLVLPVAAWILWTRPALRLGFALWCVPPAAALAAYNLASFGSLLGGWGDTAVPTWALFSQIPLSEGLPGLLVSPGRGLFVYSPVLLFAVAGCVPVWRQGPPALRALSLGLVLVVVVVSKWFFWWGGHSWGPRLLADTAPVFCLFLYPVAGSIARRPLLRTLFIASVVMSVAAHALGAALYDGRWDRQEQDASGTPRLWSWTGGPLAFYGRELGSTMASALSSTARDAATGSSSDPLRAAFAPSQIADTVMARETVLVSVDVTNTGHAVWPASSPGERGAVKLGWRWYQSERAESEGRAALASNVRPGERASLAARVPAPLVPGQYTLVVDMVSEHVAWFADLGSAPIRATIRVFPLDARRLLAPPGIATAGVPDATIATDRGSYRPGDLLRLSVTLRYPHHPRGFDGYLVLESADGRAFFFDGQRIVPASNGEWRAWVKDLPLPGLARGAFAVTLPSLPPGRSRWHVVLAEPGTYRAVVSASTSFRVDS